MQQLVFDFPFTTSHSPADFAESSCNKKALQAIKNMHEWPYYALCIVGEKNAGKTHLTSVYHAERPTAKLLQRDDIKKHTIFNISASHIIIDDADTIRDESAFFHILNIIKERKGSVLMTALSPPSQWSIRLADLKSRICSIPVIHLEAPDDKLRFDILIKLFSDRSISIDISIAEYILKYIKKDIHILHKVVQYTDAEMLSLKKPLSRSLFRNILFSHIELMNDRAKIDFIGNV